MARLAGMVVALVLTGAVTGCTAGGRGAEPNGPERQPPGSPSVVARPGSVSGSLVMVGGPAFTPPAPAPGTVEAAVAGVTVATVGTDGAGRFELDVPPGTYVLRGRSELFGEGRLPCEALTTVTVRPGATVAADVPCLRR